MTKQDKSRDEKLAKALRENLRKRKAQARALDQSGSVPAEAGTQSKQNEKTIAYSWAPAFAGALLSGPVLGAPAGGDEKSED
jgi:hypothetical protein